MQSSLYLLKLQNCNRTIHKNNCGIKHDSYQRYLQKLRGTCNLSKKI